MKLACGIYEYVGGDVTLPIPTLPDPDPGTEPPDLVATGHQGERLMVAVGGFPTGRKPVVLWDAWIDSLSIRSREAGGNEVTVKCPATAQNMRILGDRQTDSYNQSGTALYHSRNAISRELIVGSNLDGKARWKFVVRDPWEHDGDTVTIKGVGYVGGLDSDVVIGSPTRLNLIGERVGSFESGDLTGWQIIGDEIEASVVAGGVDGGYKARVRGTPDLTNYIQARARYTLSPHNWGRQRISGQTFVQLPGYGIDIEDFALATIAIYDVATGKEVWPAGQPQPEAGVVTGEMRRGAFDGDPVTAIGYLPSAVNGYNVDVWLRLYPTDETEWTYYDGAGIIRRENTSTEFEVDATRGYRKLWDHAQRGRDKSNKGIRVSFGEAAGAERIWTWWHEDGISLPEATEALCAQGGFEVWDYPSGRREIRAAKRRGHVRTDLVLHDWDILGSHRWQIDPGAQRTAVRATSAAASNYGGTDQGAIDTRQSNGQVIDVVLSGPVGMTPNQLKAWTAQQLASLRLLQMTTTLLVPWRVGQRISVGDTFRVAQSAGAASHLDWVRVHGWSPDPDLRFVSLDVGTDPDFGGLP